jgi:hypothetical protein
MKGYCDNKTGIVDYSKSNHGSRKLGEFLDAVGPKNISDFVEEVIKMRNAPLFNRQSRRHDDQ